MDQDTYLTIKNPSEGIYKEKGSKFIALLYPVKNEQEISEILATLKKKYYDARHLCYAYILGANKQTYRQNDDGEPSGTAGRPIYGQLLSANITNALLIVIRYFGGIKLGTSGLIKAYKSASKDAIDNAEIIEERIICLYRINFPYIKMNAIMNILKQTNATQNSHLFDTDCTIDCSIRKNAAEPLFNAISQIEETSISFLGEY